MARTPTAAPEGFGRERGGSQEESEFLDKLVHINRVAKVVKGGRRFSFAALVVVGDGRGRVGYGTGKAREVPEAIRKATESAKRGMIRVPLREGRTLHHDVNGHFGAGKVVVRAAPPGTASSAAARCAPISKPWGPGRGCQIGGTANPHNMIKATFDALNNCLSPRGVAASAASRSAKSCRGVATPRRARSNLDGRPEEVDRESHPDRQPDRPQEGSARHPGRPGFEQDASDPRA